MPLPSSCGMPKFLKLNSLIQFVFIEFLLCAVHCAKYLACGKKDSALVSVT